MNEFVDEVLWVNVLLQTAPDEVLRGQALQLVPAVRTLDDAPREELALVVLDEVEEAGQHSQIDID